MNLNERHLRGAILISLALISTGCPTYPWGKKKKTTASRPADAPSDEGLEFQRRPLPGRAHRVHTSTFDVDNDGTMEIISSGMEGEVFILDRTGKGIERVRLQRGRQEFLGGDITPLNLSGSTHWLCVDTDFGLGFDPENVSYKVTLYRRDGKRLWQKELETGGQHASVEVRHGRMRDKDHYEVAILMQMMGRFTDTPDADFGRNIETRITIVDAAGGALLARRTVDEFVTFSAFIPSPTPGGADLFVINLDNDIVTCTLTGAPESQAASSRPADR